MSLASGFQSRIRDTGTGTADFMADGTGRGFAKETSPPRLAGAAAKFLGSADGMNRSTVLADELFESWGDRGLRFAIIF